jgi:hypothetical protein
MCFEARWVVDALFLVVGMRKTGVLGDGLVLSVGRMRIRDVEYRSPGREAKSA